MAASSTFKGHLKLVTGFVCVPTRALFWAGDISHPTQALQCGCLFDEACPDEAWWHQRIANAVAVRRDLSLFQSDKQNACRLVHAEGDGLPGLIADFYNGVLVLQCHTPGMHRALPILAQSSPNVFGRHADWHLRQELQDPRQNGGEASEDGWIWGQAPDNHVAIEHGHCFDIDWEQGQKTGFFLDQRENRALLGRLSQGKKVLNVFSYTGGFSIYALKAGATEVHSLDSSQRALDVCEQNVALNGLSADQHRSIQADALEYLKADKMGDYDIVVLDPPAFAKRASARHAAVQGYKRINLRALQGTKAGSLLFTFSCSQAVDDLLFTNTIVAAAIQAGRNVREILHRLHQPRPPSQCLSPGRVVPQGTCCAD